MNCSKCNAENPQGAQFCSECGAELSAIPGFAKFREIVRKRSKIAFVLMHIANVFFSLIAVPIVIAHSLGVPSVQYMGSYDGPNYVIIGLLFGILLFVTNACVIRFLKSVTDLFVEKNDSAN